MRYFYISFQKASRKLTETTYSIHCSSQMPRSFRVGVQYCLMDYNRIKSYNCTSSSCKLVNVGPLDAFFYKHREIWLAEVRFFSEFCIQIFLNILNWPLTPVTCLKSRLKCLSWFKLLLWKFMLKFWVFRSFFYISTSNFSLNMTGSF